MSVAQLGAAERIVISQEGVASETAFLRRELESASEDVTAQLEALTATFEWGFSELIWIAQQHTALLSQIRQLLMAPLDTQAQELRKRAEYAYEQGWYEEALADFVEAERKNPYDFVVHHYTGNILLFHSQDYDRAVEYYERAAKYAVPRAPACAAFALLHAGEARERQGDAKAAYEITKRAVAIPGSSPEVFYQHARHCAEVGEFDEGEWYLERAIGKCRYYCAKCSGDESFQPMRGRVEDLLKRIRDRLQAEARRALSQATALDEHLARKVIPFLGRLRIAHSRLRAHVERDALARAQALIETESILECWRGMRIAQACHAASWILVENSDWEEKLEAIESGIWSKWDLHNSNVAGLVGLIAGALFSFVVSSLLFRDFPSLSGGRMFLFTLSLIFFWSIGGVLAYLGFRSVTYRTGWLRNVAPRVRRRRQSYAKLLAAIKAMQPKHVEWQDAIHQ